MVSLSQGDQQMIIFEDDTRDQLIYLDVPNRSNQRMRFGWETTFGFLLKVVPTNGVLEPGETKTFEVRFQGGQLSDTDIMDSDHHVKMWMVPADTRKRGHENTELSVPIIFAVHVQPKNAMEYT